MTDDVRAELEAAREEKKEIVNSYASWQVEWEHEKAELSAELASLREELAAAQVTIENRDNTIESLVQTRRAESLPANAEEQIMQKLFYIGFPEFKAKSRSEEVTRRDLRELFRSWLSPVVPPAADMAHMFTPQQVGAAWSVKIFLDKQSQLRGSDAIDQDWIEDDNGDRYRLVTADLRSLVDAVLGNVTDDG